MKQKPNIIIMTVLKFCIDKVIWISFLKIEAISKWRCL